MLKPYFLILLIHLNLSMSEKNNVCKNFLDYLTIDYNENCWYNPDVGSSAEQLITRRGYPFESYAITTEDGYINIMYRIPHNNTNHNSTRQPVLLHAGFTGSPLTFLTIGNRSLAFFLVNNGFDIWLPNRRGTAVVNSKGHLHLNRTDKEFWNYSFHECGYYDIKAEVDFIVSKTKEAGKVILLGYSMGTTESYIYASLRKEHAKKHVAGIISLSPIAYMTHSRDLIGRLSKISGFLEGLLRTYKINALFDGPKMLQVHKRLSLLDLIRAKNLMMLIAGYDPFEIDPVDLPAYLMNRPASSPIKLLVHFAQEVNANGNFQQFDYGPVKNLLLYNSTSPPAYNVSAIEIPVHLFYGEGDLIANKQDVFKLYNKLAVKNKSLTSISQDKKIKFNHVDFVLAKDIKELLYKVLLKKINENLRG